MRKILNCLIYITVIAVTQNIGKASVIVYMPYHAKTDVAKFKTTNQFVICDNCKPQTIVYANYKNVQQYSILHAMSNSAKKSILSNVNKLLHHSLTAHPAVLQDASHYTQDTQAKLNIYFDFDSYKINNKEKQLLDKFAQTNKNKKVTVEGFTDCTGSRSYNNTLAAKRAETVAKYLRRKGVKVTVKTSYGKYLTEKSDKASRRTIIIAKKH